jgi:hypothetical protein
MVISVASTSAAVDCSAHQLEPNRMVVRITAHTARAVAPAMSLPTKTLSRNL